jgi:hypothetical protein
VRRWVAWNRRTIALAVAVVAVATGLIAVGRQLRKDLPPVPLLAPDPEQAIRDEIAEGKVARLLDAEGRPRSESWPLGPAELRSSPEDGGTFNFEARETRVLLLLKDPGAGSYRVRAEISQKKKFDNVALGALPDTSDVGLVMGYAGQNTASGDRAHIMMVLKFTEFDPESPPQMKRWLELADVGGTCAAGFAPRSFVTKLDVPGVELFPAKGQGQPWRVLEATVTPAGVWIPGPKGTPQLAACGELTARRASIARSLSEGLTGAVDPFPDWSSPLPLGIWAKGSWVIVRNVTVEAVK